MSKLTTILILGTNGMLGRTIYTYLHGVYPRSTWGTLRAKHDTFLPFNAHKIAGLDEIYTKIGRFDYIINCIGILPGNKDEEEMRSINAEFPHKLASFAETRHSKVIHISTDGVFAPTVGNVTESDMPKPIDLYGQSKLEGESQSKQVLSFRTSLIGLDPINHRGLLEWATHAKKPISGFTNQLWSGCSTLQFAQLCEKVISENAFDSLREKSSVFHFAPLSNVSKYEILKVFLTLTNQKNSVLPTENSNKVTRQLNSNFTSLLWFDEFSHELKRVLEDSLRFTL